MEQEFKGRETASGDVRKAVLEEARRLIEKHAPHAGVHPTIVPGLTLYRIESNAFIEPGRSNQEATARSVQNCGASSEKPSTLPARYS